MDHFKKKKKNNWQENHDDLDLSIWQTFSQQINEVSLSLQGKYLTVFADNDRIQG